MWIANRHSHYGYKIYTLTLAENIHISPCSVIEKELHFPMYIFKKKLFTQQVSTKGYFDNMIELNYHLCSGKSLLPGFSMNGRLSEHMIW